MFKQLTCIILFSSTLTCCMDRGHAQGAPNPHYPPQHTMVSEATNELMDKVPPMRMTMDDYAVVARDTDHWLHTEEELVTFEQIIKQHPLYQQMCADPVRHAELIDSIISETKQRICSHVGSCFHALISPCTPALWSAFFAIRAYKSAQRGEGCCAECGMSCLSAAVSCGRCSKSAKAMRGITKTTHKTCRALDILRGLHQTQDAEPSEEDDAKKDI